MARGLITTIRSNRGNAVLEFALVFPLLLLVSFGITEFGRAWMTMNVLTSAAREGVRLAAVTAPNTVLVEARVREVCDAANIDPTSITVVPPDPMDPDRRVSVTVVADFEVFSVRILDFRGTIPLSTTSVMRHESL